MIIHSKKSLIFLLLMALVSSCAFLYEYRSLHEFDGMEWDNSQAQTFDFTISEDGNYNIEVIGRHLSGFPFRDLKASIHVNGAETMLEDDLIIPVIGDFDMYVNEGGGDFWDFTFPAFTSTQLPAGKYTATINHTMNQNPLNLMMEIGLQVEKVD
jgi:gliding motility-associated lipoprotein GldH